MKKYLFLFLGGAIGSVLRFLLKNSINFKDFPINTLIINISGCFLLAIFLTCAYEFINIKEELKIGIATGVFGAFTTFSTVIKELFFMLKSNNFSLFFEYLFLTIILGLFAILLGVIFARLIFKLLHKTGIINPLEYEDAEIQ